MNVRRLIPPVSVVLLVMNLGGCVSTRCYMDQEELWSNYCESRALEEAFRRERRWRFSQIHIRSRCQHHCAYSCAARPEPAASTPKLPGKHSPSRQHSQYDQPLLPPKPVVSPEEREGVDLQSINPPQPWKGDSAPTIIEVEPAPLPVEDAPKPLLFEESPESLQAEPPPERIVYPAAPMNTLRSDAPSPTDEPDGSPAAPRNVIPQNQQP